MYKYVAKQVTYRETTDKKLKFIKFSFLLYFFDKKFISISRLLGVQIVK